MGQNSDLTAFTSKIQVFCRPEWPKWAPHENEFWQFSNTKINITNSSSAKNRWKKGVICLVSFFDFWVMVLKLPKIVHFLQICADFSKKSKSIKAIYLSPSKRPHHALSENIMFYRGLSNSSRVIKEWNIKKRTDSSQIWQNSSTSNTNIF